MVLLNEQTLNQLIPFGVFTASLLGSVHCAGMCGPILFLVGKSQLDTVVYHLSRLMGYAILGVVVGSASERILFKEGKISDISDFLTILSISAIILLTLSMLLTRFFPKGFAKYYEWVMKKTSQTLRSSLIGFGSVFLPCGFLWIFVGAAAASGSSLRGAMILFFFWLGTIPALLISSKIISRFKNSKVNLIRRASALTILSLVILLIVARLYPKELHIHANPSEHKLCH